MKNWATKEGKTLEEMAVIALQVLTNYVGQSCAGDTHVVDLQIMEEMTNSLDLGHLIRHGGLSPTTLPEFLKQYLDHSMHMHHPGYIGHQVAVPHPAAGVADLIHGVIGNPMSIYEMGPAAAAVESELVSWMLEKLGWYGEGSGLFTGGGSLSNIHAMLTARSKIDPQAWKEGPAQDLVVLAPDNAHYSIARAVSIVGLGSRSVIPIPTDANEVVIAVELEKIITEQKRKGLRIMAVVVNACATSTGLYDPLQEIGSICNAHEVWLHVDSPHGATALLSEKYKNLLKGIELADSLSWDAHKMMQTSALSTALLFKNKKDFQKTFAQKGSYLFYEKENPGYDVLPYQIECTKGGIAFKLFLVLAVIGESGMAEFIESIYDRTRAFADIIKERPGFESPFPVESNIICFRYKPEKYDQLRLREKIIRTKSFYITSTEVKGVRFLRLVVMHLGTTERTICDLLNLIEKIAGDTTDEILCK